MRPSKFLDGAMSSHSSAASCPLWIACGRNWSILEQFAVALPQKKQQKNIKKNQEQKKKKSKKESKLYIYIITTIIIIIISTKNIKATRMTYASLKYCDLKFI